MLTLYSQSHSRHLLVSRRNEYALGTFACTKVLDIICYRHLVQEG